MIEIRILIAHTAEGLVNVATQVTEQTPLPTEAQMNCMISEALDDIIQTMVAGTGYKCVRKDYPKGP